MGYESKIFVVSKSPSIYQSDEGKRYAHMIAMFDMCKCYPLSDILRRKPKTDCYFYADDGNTKIVEDCYGEPLTEVPIGEAVQIVERVMQNSAYWRFNILYAALKEIARFDSSANNLAVLHFGY